VTQMVEHLPSIHRLWIQTPALLKKKIYNSRSDTDLNILHLECWTTYMGLPTTNYILNSRVQERDGSWK
jgi:hypothetical protein